MNTIGHVSIHGEALTGFKLQIKISLYPPNLSTWWLDLKRACGIEKIKNTLNNRTNKGRTIHFCFQIQWPKWPHRQALSIQKVVGPVSIEQSSEIKRLGNKSGFIIPPYRTVCFFFLDGDGKWKCLTQHTDAWVGCSNLASVAALAYGHASTQKQINRVRGRNMLYW